MDLIQNSYQISNNIRMNKKLLFKVGSGLAVGSGSLLGAIKLSNEYVGYNEKNLFKFPVFLRTTKMYENALVNNIDIWNQLEDSVKTPKFCNGLIERCPELFKYMPANKKTKEICENTVRKNYRMIEFVPPEFITQEMFENILDNNRFENILDNIRLILEFIPNSLHHEMYSIVLGKKPNAWYDIRTSVKTQEFCNEMVGKHPKLFAYINAENRTKKLCEDAVNKDIDLFSYVPEELITSEMCEQH